MPLSTGVAIPSLVVVAYLFLTLQVVFLHGLTPAQRRSVWIPALLTVLSAFLLLWPTRFPWSDLVTPMVTAGWLVLLAGFRTWATGDRLPLWRIVAISLCVAAAWSALLLHSTAQSLQVYVIAMLILSVAGLFEIEQIARRVPREQSWVLKHGLIGLGIFLAVDVYLYADALLFQHIDAGLVDDRLIIRAICCPFLMASAARLSGNRRRLRLSQKGAIQSVVLSLVGLYLILMACAGYLMRTVGGGWGQNAFVIFLFSSLLPAAALFVSGSARAKLRVLVSKHFFHYRYDYREEWLRFVRTVAEDASGETMHQRILKATAAIVEAAGGALWQRSDEDRAFLLSESWNMGDERLSAIPTDHPLMKSLESLGWVIDLVAFRERSGAYPDLQLPDWLKAHSRAWIIVPFLNRERLVGIAVLGSPLAPHPLAWEDFDILKAVGHHAAGYLTEENALNALSDSRRLDAFNRRFAFVIHDIKNVVGQMSLLLRNAERFGDEPEFQQDMLETVRHSVERLTNLLQQIRSADGLPTLAAEPGPQSPKTPVAEDGLVHIIRATEKRWKMQHPDLVVGLHDVTDDLTLPSGREMTSVLDHLLQNAFDAAGSGGSVKLQTFADAGDLVIEVADTGVGMDMAFARDKLFRPLVSEKSGGWGVGAFQCREQVRAMGGRLEVFSEPGIGTSMRVVLPWPSASNPSADSKEAQP